MPLAPIDLMDSYSLQLSRQLPRAYNIFVKGGNGRQAHCICSSP